MNLDLVRRFMRGSPALTWFGLLVAASMVPTLVAWGVDDRTLRGVDVWLKPLKFMASISVFSLCTAWFVGLLPAERRREPAVTGLVWTLILAGLFELGYITLMAGLGQASHFNDSHPLYVVMYGLMGVGAVSMTATQLVLAVLLVRHGGEGLAPTSRDGVVAGLVLTFVLATFAGILLSVMQPPEGTGLALVGWHASGDLRPAHFLGLHAQQLVPAVGMVVARVAPATGRAWFAAFVVGYVALWARLLVAGLSGAALTLPEPFAW